MTDENKNLNNTENEDFWTSLDRNSWNMDIPEDDLRPSGEPSAPTREDKTPAPAKKQPASHVTKRADDSISEDDPFWQLSDRPKAAQKEKAPEADKPSGSWSAAEEPRMPEEKKPRSHKGLKLTLVIVGVVLALILGIMLAGGWAVTYSAQIYPNVYVDGVFVGGRTPQEADAILRQNGWDEQASRVLTVTLPGDVSYQVEYCRSGEKMSRQQAVDAAYAYGHSGGWIGNLWKFIINYLAPVDAALDNRQLDKDYIASCTAQGVEKMKSATADAGYRTDETAKTLTLTKGAGRLVVKEDELNTAIANALEKDQSELRWDNIVGTLDAPDFQALHDEVAVEPADAYFDEGFEIVREQIGVDFDVDEAKRLWSSAAPGSPVVIPLTVTAPSVTADGLSTMLYKDKLGSQTTSFLWSSDNRISNINLAASKLDGIVLLPGETLSYNETVGQRTEETGFLEASAYSDGQVIEAIGGGICQVSSTLYCAEMFANLKTVSRTNHYFKVDYLDYGLDATVSWTKPDFKFQNNRSYPVKIAAYCDNDEKTLTIEIWGTDEDGTYVELRHTSTNVYDEEYTDVHIGYTVVTYRQIYSSDGTFMYETAEPGGVYYFHDEDIEWPKGVTGRELLIQY